MRFAALVEYDGTRFRGFQRQSPEKGPTVQGEIEAALAGITRASVLVRAAGRTDSGVHASGQVIDFAAEARLDAGAWQRALNAHLPPDIAIRAVCAVGDDFHARTSATARSYRYRIVCAPDRRPLVERYVWRVPRPLDAAVMHEAAQVLVGEHDFGAFGSSPHDRRGDGFRGHTVRDLQEARCLWRTPDRAAPGAMAAITETEITEVDCHFTANAFLTGMVRRLVGTLVLVGMGRLTAEDVRVLLAVHEKAHPGVPAPAAGLCLTGVEYPAGLLAW